MAMASTAVTRCVDEFIIVGCSSSDDVLTCAAVRRRLYETSTPLGPLVTIAIRRLQGPVHEGDADLRFYLHFSRALHIAFGCRDPYYRAKNVRQVEKDVMKTSNFCLFSVSSR